jgi:ketosteroid isomerase-like protein
MTATPDVMEATIRRYFAAHNSGDYDALVSCLASDAVHYFPTGLLDVPWRGADTIARKWVWSVETLGSHWSIEKIPQRHPGSHGVDAV